MFYKLFRFFQIFSKLFKEWKKNSNYKYEVRAVLLEVCIVQSDSNKRCTFANVGSLAAGQP